MSLSWWFGWLVGLVTPFVVVAVYSWLQWAFGRTTGYGHCLGTCNNKPVEIGVHINLVVWLLQLWHKVWWSQRPSHRRQVLAYWQRKYDEGLPLHPRMRKYLDKHKEPQRD